MEYFLNRNRNKSIANKTLICNTHFILDIKSNVFMIHRFEKKMLIFVETKHKDS